MMLSPFDPQHQSKNLDARITVALERISEAFRVMLWETGKKHKLSPIQVQLLIFLRYHEKGHCTITCLSEEFAMSKPTISEVVKTLGGKNLIQKVGAENDSRSFYIQLSPKGKDLAEALGGFSNQLCAQFKNSQEVHKEAFYQMLLSMMTGLRNDKIIKRQRMCPSCEHLSVKKNSSYCEKLTMDLSPHTYLVDCCSHQEKKA